MSKSREKENFSSINFIIDKLGSFTKYIFAHPEKIALGLLVVSSPIIRYMMVRYSNFDANVLATQQLYPLNQSLFLDDNFCRIDENKRLEQNIKEKNIFQDIEINKKNHAKNIQDVFKKINIIIPLEYILSSFNSLQKLGVTNTYLTIHFQDVEYIVRLNGKVWPPYERIYEQNVLSVLKLHNIETTVLFNNDHYQICKKSNEKMALSSILKNENDEKIYKALELSGAEIAKYQQLDISTPLIDYPIEKMFNDANNFLHKKFTQNYPASFSEFEENGKYLLKYLSYSNKIVSHNDLLPSSIFIDFTNSKISIVDWEYSALAYWSNDLSLLGASLTDKQTKALANYYYSYQNKTFSDTSWLQLQANIYIHQFLKLAWKVNHENIFQFQPDILILKEKNTLVEKIKNKKNKALLVLPQSLFKSRPHKKTLKGMTNPTITSCSEYSRNDATPS